MSGTGDAVLWIVPSERHVERWPRDPRAGADRVETRERLRTRLFDALVRDRVMATPVEVRVALAQSLPAIAASDPLLASLARGAGDAWERTLDAIDDSVGALLLAGVRPESLARAAKGATTARARMLEGAMRALHAALDARGLVDPRAVGSLLAERIPTHPPAWVADAARARTVVARFVLDWDGADAAWWRALDAALVRAGGRGTRVELASFDEGIDPSRERGPLDVVVEDVARALDAPPYTLAIDAPLGDLRLVGALPAGAKSRVESCAAADAEAQARAALHAVQGALRSGCGADEIAIAASHPEDSAVSALRQLFDEARVPLHDARGEAPVETGVVAFALRALALAGEPGGPAGLSRLAVAGLARSGYVDPARVGTRRSALDDLAGALERTASSAADDPRASLIATARASVRERAGRELDVAQADARASLVARLADVALGVARPMPRAQHAAAARALFDQLGVDPLASGAGRRALASDEPPRDAERAELHAAARDAHAWELLQAALLDYEAAAARLHASAPIAPHTFRHELARALDARAGRPPSARAGAVRVAELGELALEKLSLLVVIDANDGALPWRGEEESLIHEGLASALRKEDPVRAPPSPTVKNARGLASLALASANARRVVFLRRGVDEEGAAMAASPVVAWLERGGITPVPWRASPLEGPAVTPREASLRAGAAIDRDVLRRASIERTREARFELAAPPAEPLLGDLDVAGTLHPQIVQALLADTGGADRPLGVTNLERLATCAFQGFSAQVLRAAHERPVRELPAARESGTLTHRALAAAFAATATLWAERPRDAARIRALASDAVQAVLGEEAIASVLRRLALARVRAAVDAVVSWSLADETWDFVLAEQPFGDRTSGADRAALRADAPSAWPPLVLDDGTTRLSLRGTIDRVDVGHGRAAVRAIDYKTSRRAADAGMRELGDTAFQIALYARAAAEALARPGREGAYVFASRPGEIGPRVKKDFEGKWTRLHASEGTVTALEASALGVVARVRAGAVAPRPYEDSACARCDVSGGCRKPRFAIVRDEE